MKVLLLIWFVLIEGAEVHAAVQYINIEEEFSKTRNYISPRPFISWLNYYTSSASGRWKTSGEGSERAEVTKFSDSDDLPVWGCVIGLAYLFSPVIDILALPVTVINNDFRKQRNTWAKQICIEAMDKINLQGIHQTQNISTQEKKRKNLANLLQEIKNKNKKLRSLTEKDLAKNIIGFSSMKFNIGEEPDFRSNSFMEYLNQHKNSRGGKT
ncbi:MAG: hypothetical protein OXE99_04610 [Cellvibrionales bacterium]|nr:hypothetical protein [Cellvibrionales bacterium]